MYNKFRSFLFGLLATLVAVSADAAVPTIDASGFGGAVAHSTPSTVSYTQTSPNDILVLIVFGVRASLTPTSINSVTTPGLTWHNRCGLVPCHQDLLLNCGGGLSCGADTEEWWTFSPVATPITATITYAAAFSSGVAMIFGVNGAGSFTSPFDPNITLPAIASNTTGVNSGVKIVSGFSTTVPNALQFDWYGISFPLAGNPGPCVPWGAPGFSTYGADGTDPKAYLPGIFRNASVVSTLETILGYDVGSCTNKAAQNWVILADSIPGTALPPSGNTMIRLVPW